MDYARYASYRNAKGLTDADVSRATGIRQSALCDWKHSRYTPKTDKLAKIAQLFQMPLDDLVGNETSREPRCTKWKPLRPSQLKEILLRYLSEPLAEQIVYDAINVMEGRPLHDGVWIDFDPEQELHSTTEERAAQYHITQRRGK
jgi:transcriptional regulator with XRE-family HTH domain